MKKNFAFTGQVKWISFLLFAYLISACGTLEIHIEGTHQVEDFTLTIALSSQTAVPSNSSSPPSTPHATNTPTALPSETPFVEPSPTNPPSPTPHFLPGGLPTITYIEMFDASTGWAIGRNDVSLTDHILTTMDGGHTWHDVTPPELPLEEGRDFLYKPATGFFLDDQEARVMYGPDNFGDPVVIWSTSSGGDQWTESDPFNVTFHAVEDLYFSDVSHGWLMLHLDSGMGHAWIELYRMNENRWQWDLLIDPYSESSADLHYCCKTGMVFYGSNTGLVTFGRGPAGGAFINRTGDGGLTWTSHHLPFPEGTFENPEDEVYFRVGCESHSPMLFSELIGRVALECLVGAEGSEMLSFILNTQDGGINWQSRTYPGGQMLFINPDVGWALGKDIYQTADGGQTWTKMSTVQWEGRFSFVSEQLGWAVARSGEEYALVQTEDGGKTWYIIEYVIKK